jgi:hypothetical protein
MLIVVDDATVQDLCAGKPVAVITGASRER